MKITKQIAALFLLSIFLFNTMGYFIAFKVTQMQIKSEIFSEIKSGINTDSETIITINKNELTKIDWTENGREMVYKNKRYDVVKTQEDNNTITYYCINDKQEETLFADLDIHINTHIINTKPTKNNAPKSLENDVVQLFFNHHHQLNFNTTETTLSFFPIKEDYNSAHIKTNSPPPEFV